MKRFSYLAVPALALGLCGWTSIDTMDELGLGETSEAETASTALVVMPDDVAQAIMDYSTGRWSNAGRGRPLVGEWQSSSGTSECHSVEPLKMQCSGEGSTTDWAFSAGTATQTINPGQENERTITWEVTAYGFQGATNFWFDNERTVMANGQSLRISIRRIAMGDMSAATVQLQPADGSAPPAYYGFATGTRVTDAGATH